VLVTFFIQPALFAAYTSTLAQYVSNYFHWTLAETSYILSPPLGILHLAVILILPPLSAALTNASGRFRMSVFSKDLLLTKISLLFLIAGAILEGFSTGIVLFLVGLTIGTLGSADTSFARAVATAYVEPHMTSQLYALTSMAETSGAFIGGPVLAWCFGVGLSRGGMWRGLPWFYAAGLLVVALGALMFVRRPEGEEMDGREGGDGNSESGYQSAEDQR
jgi:PCFT/HCP family folate transporter-like MFS transporter 1/3